MARVSRPDDEQVEQIRQQLRLLVDAAARYDAGGAYADDEALNMALRLRALLHTTDRSKAAMETRLGDFRVADYYSSAPPGTGVHMSYLQQTITIKDVPGVRFKAPLNEVRRTLPVGRQARALVEAPPFERWWNAVVLRDLNGHEFTRRQIVLAVANQDGGAHVDPTLESQYFTISRDGAGFGLSIKFDDGNTYAAGSPIAAAIRQITWEFVESVRRTHPDLLPDA